MTYRASPPVHLLRGDHVAWCGLDLLGGADAHTHHEDVATCPACRAERAAFREAWGGYAESAAVLRAALADAPTARPTAEARVEEADGPHATGPVRCACGREWVGVWPVGEVEPLTLQCPSCGEPTATPRPCGVVSLSTVRMQPHPDVVALCRDLLRRAEAGDVRGVAVATSCDGRAEGSAYELGDGGVAALHLSLVRLQHRLLGEGCT